MMKIEICVALVIVLVSTVKALPYGCAYANGVHSCDIRFSQPLSAVELTPQPQRLHIYNIDNSLDANTFVEWDQVNKTLYDSNYDAELILECVLNGGELTMSADLFATMAVYKSVLIRNCIITNIPANVFEPFGQLNFFGISGGKIEAIEADGFAGFVVLRDVTSILPKGELSFVDVEMPGGAFDITILASHTGQTVLTIDGSDFDSVPTNIFSDMTNLTTLNLQNNGFTYLPSGLFSGLKALTNIDLAGIPLECTCSKLWWVDYMVEHNMRLSSEAICDSPSSAGGKKASYVYSNNCADLLNCDGGTLPAMKLGNITCLTYLQLAIYVFALVAFFGLIILSYCWVKTKNQMAAQVGSGGQGRNRVAARRAPPPQQKGGWH